MCEHDSSDDILRGNELSRRRFGALGLGATLAAMLPAVAAAAEVSESEVEIKTPDGTCDAHFVHPAEATAAVLVWPDIWGLRPAFRAMGKRLAEVRVCRTHGEPLLSFHQRTACQPRGRVQVRGHTQRHHACVRCEGLRGLAGCAEGR